MNAIIALFAEAAGTDAATAVQQLLPPWVPPLISGSPLAVVLFAVFWYFRFDLKDLIKADIQMRKAIPQVKDTIDGLRSAMEVLASVVAEAIRKTDAKKDTIIVVEDDAAHRGLILSTLSGLAERHSHRLRVVGDVRATFPDLPNVSVIVFDYCADRAVMQAVHSMTKCRVIVFTGRDDIRAIPEIPGCLVIHKPDYETLAKEVEASIARVHK